MMKPSRRARLMGATLLIITFAAGFWAGRFAKPSSTPFRMIIKATDDVPDELDRLDLTDAQRERLKLVLRRGRARVERVVVDFDPRMQAAVDSTDAEIRALLNRQQRAAFDSMRIANPPLRRHIVQP